jgi:hypothetical protein
MVRIVLQERVLVGNSRRIHRQSIPDVTIGPDDPRPALAAIIDLE